MLIPWIRLKFKSKVIPWTWRDQNRSILSNLWRHLEIFMPIKDWLPCTGTATDVGKKNWRKTGTAVSVKLFSTISLIMKELLLTLVRNNVTNYRFKTHVCTWIYYVPLLIKIPFRLMRLSADFHGWMTATCRTKYRILLNTRDIYSIHRHGLPFQA